MLREDVAPSLRRLGLKGSGQVYTIPSSTHWAIVAFQKSAYSDADLVRFTLNLTVARKDEWAAAYAEKQPVIGRRPMPNTYVPVGSSWHSRIGHLMPSK